MPDERGFRSARERSMVARGGFRAEEVGMPQPVGKGQGEAEVTGIGRYPTRPLHHYWIDTVRAAADTLPADGPEGWVDVQTSVFIKHSSPGWVDGFRVHLGGG